MSEPTEISGISKLIDTFDVFFLDQFGVLHDGTKPYARAVECLSFLKAAGKTTVLISNSGKRAAENEKRLVALGFEPGSWDVFLSSGEVAWQMFAKGDVFPAGTRCYLISRDSDNSAIEGLSLVRMSKAEKADVILLTASEGDRYELDHYRESLSLAAVKGIPCYCTNPDNIMLTSQGPKFGAGRIAELYESMGGKVTYIGKPYPAIYTAALDAIGNPLKHRVLCVGDSLEHDITGARVSGLQSALVRTGILSNASLAELSYQFEQHSVFPDFILPGLIW